MNQEGGREGDVCRRLHIVQLTPHSHTAHTAHPPPTSPLTPHHHPTHSTHSAPARWRMYSWPHLATSPGAACKYR